MAIPSTSGTIDAVKKGARIACIHIKTFCENEEVGTIFEL
jgi:hypothetical protein